jgi:hypothetical protein
MWQLKLTKDTAPFVLVALAGIQVAACPTRAVPPKPDAKQAHAQQGEQREYLPVLLQKTLLENELENLRSLQDFLRLFEGVREAGGVSALEKVEQEMLQARIRVVQLKTDYQDALDQFKLKFDLTPERLRKLEKSAIHPLTGHLNRVESIFTEHDKVVAELTKNADRQEPSKPRALVRQSLTGAGLFKDTRFGQQVAVQWGKWEKLKGKDLEERLGKHQIERRRLLEQRATFEAKDIPIPEADVKSLEEAELQIDLGNLERRLQAYESQPWKEEKDKERRQVQHRTLFGQVAFNTVVERAISDRIVQSRKTWPALAPVRIEGEDVLKCEMDEAEQIVGARFKKPDGAVAAKTKVRKVRALAETYRLQQRLFELSLLRIRTILDNLVAPPVPDKQADDTRLTQQLLNAQRSFSKVKAQLCNSWVNYQIARLDLYRYLKLTPP